MAEANVQTAAELTEGWTWLWNSPKWHYFRNGRSLCRNWGLFAKSQPFQADAESPDNCKECWRRRQKELTK